MKYLLISVSAALLSIAACKKDDNTVVKADKDVQPNQLQSVLSFSKFSISKIGSGTYEYGCFFRPKVAGKITALSCLMPDKSTYEVHLWDTTGQQLLASASINQNDTWNGGSFPITAVSVSPSKVYLISLKSTNTRWYHFRPMGSATISYPLSTNYVDFLGYLWSSATSSTSPVYPKNNDKTYIAGLADFSFKPE